MFVLRAFAVKALAAAACALALAFLPAAWAGAVVAAIVLTTVAFLAYAIAHPRSQFFVRAITELPTAEPVVALTFDDGPDPVVTPRILEILRAHGAQATFFVLGARAQAHPELVRRIYDEGHAVGTHTQRHRLRFHFGSARYVQQEVEQAIEVVAGLLPVRPTLFRPPQGLRSPCFAAGWRRVRGQTCVIWSVRGLDSRPTTAAAIVARVRRGLRPGAIVTLHDGTGLGGGHDRAPTLEALGQVLADCQARGLRCVALPAMGTAVP